MEIGVTDALDAPPLGRGARFLRWRAGPTFISAPPAKVGWRDLRGTAGCAPRQRLSLQKILAVAATFALAAAPDFLDDI